MNGQEIIDFIKRKNLEDCTFMVVKETSIDILDETNFFIARKDNIVKIF